MTADLVAFLRARLDEDTAAVHAASERIGPDWDQHDSSHMVYEDMPDSMFTEDGLIVGKVGVSGTKAEADHVFRWSPARVLADIDAKRNLLSAIVAAKHDYDHWHAQPPADPEFRAEILAKMTARWSAWSYVLAQLALPYARHPEWREEWRPAG